MYRVINGSIVHENGSIASSEPVRDAIGRADFLLDAHCFPVEEHGLERKENNERKIIFV